MPPKSRRAAASAAAPAADENSEGSPLSSPGVAGSPPPEEPPGTGLKFNKPLTWRAGKPIALAELLKRLQELAKELREKEQEEDDGSKDAFIPIAKSLSTEQLLAHKDMGVRAYTACCAVDVLRLCAPTAPFSSKELKAVFDMILKSILPALSDPQHAYNQQHMYVLQSLSEVKSIVLATDLPNADSYIEHLFALFFDILSGSAKTSTGEQLSKQVVFNMTSILVVLVDEMEALPQEVVDTIIAQFLRVDSRIAPSNPKSKKNSSTEDRQSTLEMRELPPAYSMSKTICNSCEEKMSREVSKYFADVIMEATASSRKTQGDGVDADAADESTAGPSEEDLKELEKAHRLLRELWRASPPVLQNVIPQLEAELQAEDVRLRLLATETLGDIVSGIGAAGPPLPPAMDPAAYPQAGIEDAPEQTQAVNLFTVPSSPQSFPQTFSSTWMAFLGRKQDKSAIIRAAWTTAVGRIIATAAGGTGLAKDEKTLVEELARMLNDSDEKVRLAGVRAVSFFSLKDIVVKLSVSGGIDKEGSVLANLSERVKDRKPFVREEAMTVIARIWGVASGELSHGNETVRELIGGAASKILNAFYTNDPEIQVLIDKALFEILLPLPYPPIKSKASKTANGSSQRVQDSQGGTDEEERVKTPDEIRAERILVLVQGLDDRAKKVFFSICGRQVTVSKYMIAFLQSCEQYNAGVIDQDEDAIKARLTKLVNEISKFLPDQQQVAGDLWKFAKAHDRRSYQLLRFCMKPEYDYRTVLNSLKEFKKRLESSSTPAIMETFIRLIYRSSIIIYNRSHVPTFMAFAKSDENSSLASTAHGVLSEISQRTPEVLKANVKDICLSLQNDAPTATKQNSPGSVQTLKTCAAFARKYTGEIPRDQKFTQAMVNFALYGSPPESAKHAVSILMASSERKELVAADLVKKCVHDFQFGKKGFLPRLAALSRLCLLAPSQVDDYVDEIIDISIKEVLLKTREPSSDEPDAYQWSVEVDDECLAKIWALRVLVNRIRAHSNDSTLTETAQPVYGLLEKLVSQEGELSSKRNTPASHKSRLRLTAARSYLKLCQQKAHEQLLTSQAFQSLALVAQDTQFKVRAGFLQRLKKYLGRNSISPRFYAIPFLLAYEPEPAFKNETSTWLKSRAAHFATYKTSVVSSADPSTRPATSKVATTFESVFPRLISLLAHHPDYGDATDELKEFARYIVFYLLNVASEHNVSLIFNVAQRVKAYRDAFVTNLPVKSRKSTDVTDYTTRLHTLSDLATMTTRSFIEAHGWNLQVLPARLTLTRSLFEEIKEHTFAQQVAEKSFLPEGLSDEVDRMIRSSIRRSGGSSKKRKSGPGDGEGAKKRARMSVREKKEKVPKKKKRDWDGSDEDEEDDAGPGESAADRIRSQLNASRRQSARTSTANATYRERDDSEDDEEMEAANEGDELGEKDDDDEEMPDAEASEDDERMKTSSSPAISRARATTLQKSKITRSPSVVKSTPKANGTTETKPPGKKSKATTPSTPAKSTPTRGGGRQTRSRG